MNSSNQVDTAKLRLWLNRNYQRHLSDSGAIDAKSLGEQLAWEFGLDQMLASDFAAEFARRMDDPLTAESIKLRAAVEAL